MKQYHGTLQLTRQGGRIVEVWDGGRRIRPLAPRLDLWNHSPTGFQWGYAGSGPAQLALALAADVLGDDRRAVRVHQGLKFDWVVGLVQDEPWAVTEELLLERIRAVELDRGLPAIEP